MPIFEYECQNRHCKKIVDKLVMDDLEIVWCPECSTRCKKIMSASHGIVKGKYTAKTGYTYAPQNKPLGEMR